MKKILHILIFLFTCTYFLANAGEIPLPDDLCLEDLMRSSIILTGEVIEGGGIPEESDKPISYAKTRIIQIIKGHDLSDIIVVKYTWLTNQLEEYVPVKPKTKYLFFLEKEFDHYVLAFPQRQGILGGPGPYELSKKYDFLLGYGKEARWEKLTTEEAIKKILTKQSSGL